MHAADVRMIIKIGSQEQRGGGHRGQHAGAVGRNTSAADKHASGGKQHGAGAIQSSVNHREDGKIGQGDHHAAGLVLRRLATKNAAANSSAENPPSTASAR